MIFVGYANENSVIGNIKEDKMKKSESLKKIVFIKMGSFSYTNESVLEILKKEYPNNQIVVIDIWKDIIKPISIQNILYTFYEYGPKVFLSKKELASGLVKNVYIFKKVKSEINKRLKDIDCLFTFQTQSLFDTSVEGIANYIYTDHTFLANEKYPGFNKEKALYNDKWIKCEKSIYHNARLNFTMSTNITNSIVDDYGCSIEKVKCVYAGSNVSAKKLDNLTNERFHSKNILFVGVNWERKGGPTLEKAFKIILDKYPESTLTIVGCSPKINLKNCNIVGKIPLVEVQQYYEKASIFCLPTTLEPFGIVFLEAMNNKLPIVATDIGAIPDFIKDGKNGYRIQPGESDSLAEKLLILLDSPEKCEEFGKYGFDNILENYSWNNVGIKLKEYINNSLNT